MAFTFVPLIYAQYAPVSATVMAVAAGGTRIDALTVTNTDSVPHTISINLVRASLSASAANATTVNQAVLPGQTWVSPNEAGKALAPGDSIVVAASVANKLVISAGGTQGG